jgi:hypothetical protein
MKKKFTKRQVAQKYGFRSGLEQDVSQWLTDRGIDPQYEKHIISYVKPETKHKYHPDFRLPNGIFVETKGRLVAADVKKHLLIQKQHPELDIRFVFQNPNAKMTKASKTTYAQWADKNGFLWAEKSIPEAWILEEKLGITS